MFFSDLSNYLSIFKSLNLNLVPNAVLKHLMLYKHAIFLEIMR